MPKAYSQDLRDRVITAYTEGTTRISTLSKIFKGGVNAISIWVNRYKATGDYSSKQGVGCGIKPKFTDKQAVISFLKTYPDANGIQIRDVIAFPKTQTASCLMTNAPGQASSDQLDELKITVDKDD